jgi:hypothetical protein
MSLYAPGPDGLAAEGKLTGAPGRVTVAGLRTAPLTGWELAGRLAGLAAMLIFFAGVPVLTAPRGLMAVLGRAVVVFGLAVPGLLAATLGLAALSFAVVRVLALVRVLVLVRDLAAVRGLAVAGDLAAVRDLAVVAFRLTWALAPAGFVVFRPAAFFGAAVLLGVAAGLAADIVLAAAVSALAAVVIAFVAAFMAWRAVDIVLADEVAFVAAEVILVAAEVTFAAADETVRAAAAEVGAVLAELGLALERAVRWLVARRVTPLVRVRARAVFAVPRRTGLRAVDCRGIDLPP